MIKSPADLVDLADPIPKIHPILLLERLFHYFQLNSIFS